MSEEFEKKTTKIIQCCFQLLSDLHRVMNRMSRTSRFTVGADAARLAAELMDKVVQANHHEDVALRLSSIKRSQAILSSLRLRLRLLHEAKAFSARQSALFHQNVEVIARQLNAWCHWAQSQN